VDDLPQQYPPHVLREYALLADGERAALVGPRGDIGWLCAPRFDSDAVFAALIGGPGLYAITPTDAFVWGGYYEERTLIWRSRWITTGGIVECREALAFPGDSDRVVLLRRVIAVEGDANVRVRLDPRAGFGRHELTELHHSGRTWTGRTGPLRLRFCTAARLDYTADSGLNGVVRLAEGDQLDLVLELAEQPLKNDPLDPDAAWASTERAWRDSIPDLADTIAPRDARHAYAVLRGLTSAGGGMVAAATMSLPERADSGRNYDYRYVWIRDQCFTGQAIAANGPHRLLDDSVRFVAERLLEHGPDLRPAYTTTGGSVPDQRSIELVGYPGGNDVVGNRVNTQFQLDVFGEALLLFAAAQRHDHLNAEGWRAAEIAADAIASRWTEPDAGIWELDNHRWTESSLICVAGLRAISATAPNRAPDWLALADHILADSTRGCVHPTGRWQRAVDDDRLDAALLFPSLRGAIPPDDVRTRATLRAICDDLAQDHYLYRFRHQPGPLGNAEGAFLLCGFTMALAQHQQGNEIEAMRWFERNRAACGPPGLFAEEYDVTQRQLRGNLPQAFVHALLLEAAARLAQSPQDNSR
jgi:GH15 family glucan-1,4-alpha-glucosidase